MGEDLKEQFARRLLDVRRHPVQATVVCLGAVAVVVVPTAFVAVPWLRGLG
ncbi:hypothetical protein [Nocardioides sp. InS609-2]|uniref:hypothetical protein n=1 Tax=Nocardioides sp. InS609-2 TaxID=2760705 RepID=UPI0020BF77A8|nr:hypothetical protein [Nocardioides sp. InS609-2]